MRKIEMAIWRWVGCASVFSALAQSAPAASSLETVDALLQAENQSILQRAMLPGLTVPGSGPSVPSASAAAASAPRELSLLAVYGVSPDLRIDLRYGDSVVTGLRAGQREGPLHVVSIEGTCARLVLSSPQGRHALRPCWSWSGGVSPAASPAQLEAARTTPQSPELNLPSLPMVPGLLGLMRGVSGDKPARALPAPAITQ